VKRAPLLLGLVAVTAAAGFAAPTRAEEAAATQLQVTSTTVVEQHTDNQDDATDNDDYGIVVQRLNLGAVSNGLEFTGRLDGVGLWNEPSAAYGSYLDLERLGVAWRGESVSLNAGDDYLQVGRGFLLSLRKNDEAGLDIAFRGASLEADTGPIHSRVFYGKSNFANLDALTQRSIVDVNDSISGAVITADAGPLGTVGLQAVAVTTTYGTGAKVTDDVYTGFGATWDLPAPTPWMSFYAEANLLQRELLGSSEQHPAALLSTNFFVGDATVTIEALTVEGFAIKSTPQPAAAGLSTTGATFFYNQTPTLERPDQEVLNPNDANAIRSRLDYVVGHTGLSVYVNALLRQQGQSTAQPTDQLHGYAGWEFAYGEGASHFNGSVGARNETQNGKDFASMEHADIDFVQALGGPWSLHLTAKGENWRKQAVGVTKAYVRGNAIVGLDLRGIGGVAFEYGRDDEKEGDGRRIDFYAGHVNYEISEAFTVRGVGGSQRGGLKCVNGVCREYPSFSGGRLELIARF
jgi:hypothetical protein